jgi:hypothetical protein
VVVLDLSLVPAEEDLMTLLSDQQRHQFRLSD